MHKNLGICVLVVVQAALVTGCAGMVTAFDGERVTLEHDGFVRSESVQKTAQKVCQKAGKPSATHIATTNKNPSFKPGFGAQISTYRCGDQ